MRKEDMLAALVGVLVTCVGLMVWYTVSREEQVAVPVEEKTLEQLGATDSTPMSDNAPAPVQSGSSLVEANESARAVADASEESTSIIDVPTPTPSRASDDVPIRMPIPTPDVPLTPIPNTVPVTTRTTSPYPWKEAVTTVFWVGEGESEDNAYIDNRASAWDEDWVDTFGGVDDPDDRCGYAPCGFTPKQSPFYVALPYYDYRGDGYDAHVKDVPWYTKGALAAGTLLHGRWVEVRHGDAVCYGQWRDVGPFEEYDFAYVFGSSAPKNTKGVGAGFDISPAVRDCLGVGDVSVTEWRFVEEGAVPEGPWRAR